MIKKTYDWMGKKIHSPYATPFLGMLFFIEAIFFIPVDPILILFCIEKPKSSFWHATIATICSVAGGIAGYCIGFLLWKSSGEAILETKLISSIISKETFHFLAKQYNEYAHWTILTLGFSPLPYKAATLSAGFCNISFIPFILFSVIARGSRFFLIAITIKIWGIKIKQFIDQYFNLLVTLAVIILITLIIILKK